MPQAEIKTVRQLGRNSLLHLRTLPDTTGFDCHLHARVFGNSLLQVGQQVALELTPELAFIFPKSEPLMLPSPVAKSGT